MEDADEWIKSKAAGEEGEVDIVAEAQTALAEQGIEAERRGDDLVLPALTLTLLPRGIQINSSGGNWRTSSIVRAIHPKLFADGLLEFQHGVGDSLRHSLRFGLDQWAQIDVPVLCDAIRDTPENCTFMDMQFPAEGERPRRTRRAILGPTGHMAQLPPSEDEESEEAEHPFCSCCMTTNCMDAFMPLFKSDDTLGVRLFAARDESGHVDADCRVNGEGFDEGKAALLAYAEKWPERGFEIRKQYVVFQSRPTA
jgi:hypothetical protein